MKFSFKKSLKLVTLLVLSMIIATVSAQIYTYMYIEGSGEITSGGMKWMLGTIAPGGAAIEGARVRNLNLSIPANNPRNFTDCLRLVNNDDAVHTFDLASTMTGGNTANFTDFDMVVYHLDGSRVAKISIKTSGTASALTIDNLETLYVRFEVNPVADKISGKISFTVTLTYE